MNGYLMVMKSDGTPTPLGKVTEINTITESPTPELPLVQIADDAEFTAEVALTKKDKKVWAKILKLSLNKADVVEVVRCKDCKYRSKEWYEDKRHKDGGYWLVCCENDAIAERIYGLAQDNDYCSYGERAEK